MFGEEIDVFCKGSNHLRNIMNCKVKNNLKDQTPMKKTYCSIPNPSIQKLRTILKRSWINKWKSSYASPIAVVCKKDGSFFRCDYRALIAKTILDRHPILHVQDVLDREESRRESRRGEPTFFWNLWDYANGSGYHSLLPMHWQSFNLLWRTVYLISEKNSHVHT